MADTTHAGGSGWNGWIPGCPCRRCAVALSEARQRPIDSSKDDAGSGWLDEPRSLRALAVALEHLAGPEPDTSAWSEDLARWFTRWDVASDILTEVANMDPAALRAVAGPDIDVEPPGGQRLLIAAAIRLEQGLR